MAAKKKNYRKSAKAKTPKFSFFLSLGLVLAAGYFVISLVGAGVQIKDREKKAAEVSARYEQQLAENERLQGVVDGGGENEYMERVAREKLGYVMPDEKVYYNITPGN